MNIVVDTSVLIAVLTAEPEKQKLINLTRGTDLLAPASVHWEIGNALAAMLKRKRITDDQIPAVLEAYNRIPIRFIDINLAASLQIAAEYDLYAYDAYIITCARENRCSLISLDKALMPGSLKCAGRCFGGFSMKEYTYSEARQKLSAVLDEAKREGAVRIRRRDGQAFVLKSEHDPRSPLDVKGLNLNISREEIVEYIREGRRQI